VGLLEAEPHILLCMLDEVPSDEGHGLVVDGPLDSGGEVGPLPGTPAAPPVG
jgi:hypothetical protein